MVAIEHALRVLQWQENLSAEEMPPEWMWPIDHLIADHFEWVRDERDRKFNRGDHKQEAQMLSSNDMAKGRGRNA